MAKKKKRGIVASFLKTARKRKKSAPPRSNPSHAALTDLAIDVGAAAGAYTVSRFAGRIVWNQLQSQPVGSAMKKFAPHARPLSQLLLLIGLYVAVAKIQRLKKYEAPLLIGSAISLFQSLVHQYMPVAAILTDSLPYPAIGGPSIAAAQAQGAFYEDPGDRLVSVSKFTDRDGDPPDEDTTPDEDMSEFQTGNFSGGFGN